MEEFLKQFAGYVALGIEAVAVVVIAAGAIQAVIGLVRPLTHQVPRGKKKVWQGFAVWLILGLEFMLAADILRTVVSPSFDQIGQLAAIAVIRTFLNYFLEKDLEKYSESKRSTEGA
jgi:uncharacterized membrane protein